MDVYFNCIGNSGETACLSEIDCDDIVVLRVDENQDVRFRWGAHFEIGSAGYWIDQAKKMPKTAYFRMGVTIAEEVVFCVLGGHGIPAEVGTAAFNNLKMSGIFESSTIPSPAEIEQVLREPIQIGGPERITHYRFPGQKSRTVHDALHALRKAGEGLAPETLKESLLSVSGIGPKTASWVLRNLGVSDSIAIVDVHIRRAGVTAGFFDRKWKLPNEYGLFERAFVAYAAFGGVRSSVLDACIWDQMRRFGVKGRNLLFPLDA